MNPCPKAFSRRDTSAWLVTFGDLLTLLLCFFITIVRFSPLGAMQNNQASPLVNSKAGPVQGTGWAAPDSQLSGTFLAPSHLKRGLGAGIVAPAMAFRMPVWEQDFDLSTDRLNSDAERRFREALQGLVLAQARIELCTAGWPAEPQALWQSGISRVRNLGSGLGLSERSGGAVVEYALSGPACDASDRQGAGAYAFVEFRAESVSHG